MNRLQEYLLELLKEVDEICQKYDIEYVLCTGTGLGADRHQGFIPWDDDVDIVMTNENYDKFVKIMPGEVKAGRKFECIETNKNFILTYARYVNTNSTFIQKHTAFGGATPGVKLDIFCAVPTYDDTEKRNRHRKEIVLFGEALSPTKIPSSSREKGFYEQYIKELRKIQIFGRKRYIARNYNRLRHKVNEKTNTYLLFTHVGKAPVLDARIFEDIHYAQFENIKLRISKNNYIQDKGLYGIGWIAIPKNVDKPAHPGFVDLDTPVAESMQKLSEVVDLKKTKKITEIRKKNKLYENEYFGDVELIIRKIMNVAVELATKKGDYSIFYSQQGNSINKHNGYCIDIPLDWYQDAVNELIKNDRYYDAQPLIELWHNQGKLNSIIPIVESWEKEIKLCQELTEYLYYRKDYEKVAQIINENPLIKDNMTCVIGNAWLMVNEDEFEKGLAYIEKMEKAFSWESGELLAIKGVCLENLGRKEEANAVNHRAMEIARNAFVIQMLLNKGIPIDGVFDRDKVDDKGLKKLVNHILSAKKGKELVFKGKDEKYTIFGGRVQPEELLKEIENRGILTDEVKGRFLERKAYRESISENTKTYAKYTKQLLELNEKQ